MSLMTSGVKILLLPRTSRLSGAASRRLSSFFAAFFFAAFFFAAMGASLEHELALAGLEAVVVVELLPADELLQLRGLPEAVDLELPLDHLGVGIRPLARHAVDSQCGDLAADANRAVVHGVAEPGPNVAADDLAAALHHEPGHRGGVAERDDRAALLVDPGARAQVALHDQIAAAHRRPGQGPGVALYDHGPGHHV